MKLSCSAIGGVSIRIKIPFSSPFVKGGKEGDLKEGFSSEKTGFTMIELLVVLIIVGVLVSLNMGNFSRSSEKNKAKEAEANLRLIYSAQQRYYLGEGKYYNCTSPCDDISDSSNLGIELEGDSFTYSINATTSPVSWTARATRAGSGLACSGRNMTITNQGGPIQKECAQW